MSDTDKQSLAKLVKLIEKQHELLAHLHALTDEMDAILAGKASIGTLVKRAEQQFDAMWCIKYAPGESDRYVWQYAKDRKNMKRLIHTLGFTELSKRMERYLASDEPFYVRARHEFRLFVASINTWADAASAVGDLELEHDIARTKRKQAELRGDLFPGKGA